MARGDLAEDGVDDVLDVALIEMRILRGDALHKFGLDHDPALAALVNRDAGGCQSAKRPSRLSRSTACTAPQSSMRRAKRRKADRLEAPGGNDAGRKAR